MKIKAGSYEAEIKSFDNTINTDLVNDNYTESLRVSLSDSKVVVSTIADAIKNNYDGTVTIVRSDGTELIFLNFRLESIGLFAEDNQGTERAAINFIKE